MKNGKQRKSFHGPGKSPSVSQGNAKMGGGSIKGSGGSKGRATPAHEGQKYTKKGNP